MFLLRTANFFAPYNPWKYIFLSAVNTKQNWFIQLKLYLKLIKNTYDGIKISNYIIFRIFKCSGELFKGYPRLTVVTTPVLVIIVAISISSIIIKI